MTGPPAHIDFLSPYTPNPPIIWSVHPHIWPLHFIIRLVHPIISSISMLRVILSAIQNISVSQETDVEIYGWCTLRDYIIVYILFPMYTSVYPIILSLSLPQVVSLHCLEPYYLRSQTPRCTATVLILYDSIYILLFVAPGSFYSDFTLPASSIFIILQLCSTQLWIEEGCAYTHSPTSYMTTCELHFRSL